MLGSLDNEVIFKKAFTDKFVFEHFVKDILDLDIEVGIIETEKKFTPPIGYIDFKLDVFAETLDKRFAIELQRAQYDYNFDRFMLYLQMLVAEQQKKASAYKVPQTVYLIVIMTLPYKFNDFPRSRAYRRAGASPRGRALAGRQSPCRECARTRSP